MATSIVFISQVYLPSHSLEQHTEHLSAWLWVTWEIITVWDKEKQHSVQTCAEVKVMCVLDKSG